MLKEGQLDGQRYIASNRFKVKKGAGATFEKRWATRKSRLATLEGFRFFTLLRRVGRNPGDDVPEDEYNYVSFTIWENVDNFQDWYKGEAFKEAHGGGSLFGFVEMLVNATFTLNGAPKPAFYDALLPVTTPPDMSGKRVEAGWRVVEADGRNVLDAECFAVMNRFRVAEGREIDFEQRWAQRESKLKEMDGFKAFFMLRRDGMKADDGFNYSSVTFWKDRASFESWTKSQQFAHAHGSGKPEGQKPDMSMFEGPPSPAFYEGVLLLESETGA